MQKNYSVLLSLLPPILLKRGPTIQYIPCCCRYYPRYCWREGLLYSISRVAVAITPDIAEERAYYTVYLMLLSLLPLVLLKRGPTIRYIPCCCRYYPRYCWREGLLYSISRVAVAITPDIAEERAYYTVYPVLLSLLPPILLKRGPTIQYISCCCRYYPRYCWREGLLYSISRVAVAITPDIAEERAYYTVYPKKYAHGFVVLCFVVVMQSFIMNSHEVFIHIHQGCFAGTGAIVRLPQCQWSKLDGYRKISQYITTTKHSQAKTVCIFLGIYCIHVRHPIARLWVKIIGYLSCMYSMIHLLSYHVLHCKQCYVVIDNIITDTTVVLHKPET